MAKKKNDKFDEVDLREHQEVTGEVEGPQKKLTPAQQRRKDENAAIIQAAADRREESEQRRAARAASGVVIPPMEREYNTSFVDKALYGTMATGTSSRTLQAIREAMGDGSAFASTKAHEDARVAANDDAIRAADEAKEASDGLEQFPTAQKPSEKPKVGRQAQPAGLGVMDQEEDFFDKRLGIGAGYTQNQNPEKNAPKPAAEEAPRSLTRTSKGVTRIVPAILDDLRTAVDFAHEKHLQANERARSLGYFSAVSQLMQRSGHNLLGSGATGIHKCGNAACESAQLDAIKSATDVNGAVRNLQNAFITHHMDENTNEGKANLAFADLNADLTAKKMGVSYDFSLPRDKQHLSKRGSHWEEPILPNEYGEMPEIKEEDVKRFRPAEAWDQVINHPAVKHQLNKISIVRHLGNFIKLGLFDMSNYPRLDESGGDITLNDVNSHATSLRGQSRKRRGTINEGDPKYRSGPGFLGGSVAGTTGGSNPRETIAGMSGVLTKAMSQLENLPQDIAESTRQIKAAGHPPQETASRIDDMRTRARKRVASNLVPAWKALDSLLTHTQNVRQQTFELRSNAAKRVRALREGKDPGPMSIDLPDPRMGGIQPGSKETRQNDAQTTSIPDIVGGLVSAGKDIAKESGTETEEPRTLTEGIQDRAAAGLAELSRGTRSHRRIRVSGEPEITGSVPGRSERVSPQVAREEGESIPRRAQIITGPVSPDERDETPQTGASISAAHAKVLAQIEDAHRQRIAPLMGAMNHVATEHAKNNPGAPRLSTEEILNHPDLSPKVKDAFVSSHLVRKQQIDQANRRFAH